jgi:hypothetical protein
MLAGASRLYGAVAKDNAAGPDAPRIAALDQFVGRRVK